MIGVAERKLYYVIIFVKQVFTEPSPDASETPQSLVFCTNIWLDLIVCASFFSVWRSQMETRLPPLTSTQTAPHVPLASSMINVLRRPLALISQMENTNLKFSVDADFRCGRPTFQTKAEMTGHMVASLVLEKFTESFCDNVIPTEHGTSGNGIVPYLVFPNLAPEFPWRPWMQFLQERHCDRFTSGSSQARSLLYTIMAISTKPNISQYPLEFFKPVLKLLHSIDSQ